jgi:hypothetical protein
MRSILTGVAALLAVAGTASGGAIDDALMRQKNGLWETSSATGKKVLFCVTDAVKVGAQKQTLQSMQQRGCKTMKGTVRADYMSDSGTITGGNEFIQSLARNPDLQGEQWHWLRPCEPGEKPGLQD